MPDLLKIGMTERSPDDRAREISQGTGVPAPFIVAYYEEVPDCREAEVLLHTEFAEYRTNEKREFFHLPLKDAIDVMRALAVRLRAQHQTETTEDAASHEIRHDYAFPSERGGPPEVTAYPFVDRGPGSPITAARGTERRHQTTVKCPTCGKQIVIRHGQCVCGHILGVRR